MSRLITFAAAFFTIVSAASLAADEGATLYKSKCATCHGANAEGKTSIKAPTLKGTQLDVDQLVQHVTKGEPTSKAPHNKGIAGISEDQARAIAEFVKGLK